jgi:1-acyl-sn-glycerol-3-phosphate acyltransferase
MIVYRLLRVLLHLVIGLWTCALVFPLTDRAGREWRIQHWSLGLLAICKVRVKIEYAPGAQAAPHAMIVANHISWLDIFVINAMQPCRFVAKSDIRDWPLLGWLCAAAGTIFIARGRQHDVRRIYQGLVASIQAGERVAFFPEGTTVSQGTLLPFHSNLFEAAIKAGAPVQPYALRYATANGAFDPAVEFVGDTTFAQSMIDILRAGVITAHLKLLPVIDSHGAHRRELAAAAQRSIAEALETGTAPFPKKHESAM